MTDTDYFIVVAIIGCLFAAIELAGQRLKGWHTISWWASMHPALRWTIIVGFLVVGVVGAVWFHGHACLGCIAR